MLDPANTTAIAIGVTAYAATIVTVFMYMTAYREPFVRIAVHATAWIAVWAWLGFAYHLVTSIWVAREVRIFSVAAELIAHFFMLQFVYAYATALRPASKREDILYWLIFGGNLFTLILFLSDAFGTGFIAGELAALPPEALSPEPGPFLLWFLFFYYFMVAGFAYFFYQRIKLLSGKRRRADIILSVGMIVALLMGSIGFATWYGITGPFTLLRGLAIPFYCIAVMYSITNYQLFNVRVAAAEAFVFAMWGFLFLRALLNPTLQAALPDIVILFAVIVLGLFLIRNVTRELETRIELEKVSAELRTLNQSLEDKVLERTRDLEAAQIHVEELVDRLPVGLIEVDAKNTIVRINNVAESLFGLKKKRYANTALDAHAAFAPLAAAARGDGHYEIALEKPQRDIEVTAAPLSFGEQRGRVIILRDITERRALERAKNDFIATAAHQLRTPLSAIKWTFELLEGTRLAKKQKDILAPGTKGVANLEHIAESLMASVRTAKGIESYSFSPTPLAPLLTSIVSLLTPIAEKKQIRLTAEIPSDLPPLPLDAKRLEFALVNIIDNAVRYTPAGGSVSVTCAATDTAATIAVTDTGIGIDAEDQEHLFEKFFRAKSGIEFSADGTGLGLAIAQEIIAAHGGTIAVRSEVGAGSTFTVTLPLPANDVV